MSDVVTDLIAAYVTSEGSMGKHIGGIRYPTHHEVAQRAYRLYETRGRVDGHDTEDWLRAEKELARRYAYSDAGASGPEAELDAVSAFRNASTLRS
jgi:hypothetical protein